MTHLTELVFAGTDTTANLMAATVRILDSRPELLAELRSKPELWSPALEEALRLNAGSNGIFRITTKDVEVAGTTIPARSVVYLSLASAGHDESVFPNPRQFDMDRPNLAEHVGFGKGRHFCMGAPLTRVEAPIGMRLLYERLPGLRVSEQTFEYDPIVAAVVLKHLRVTW